MSKFLSLIAIHILLKNNNTPIINMSKRITTHSKGVKSAKLNRKTRDVIPAKKPFCMKNRKEKVEILLTPQKSQSDKKEYKVIRLENGLTALLISDLASKPKELSDASDSYETASSSGSEEESEETSSVDSNTSCDDGTQPPKSSFEEEKMAACALSVNVGSFSDPMDVQGLAHFVEHMVFMGSEKYPKENDFDAFIKKKGGSDNASTDLEVTTFYFEINEKYFAQALDKFSNFFVAPLMKKEAMQREREAVQSEFALSLPSDSSRKEQLISSLFPDGHPVKKFTWGNMESLKDMVKSDDYLHEMAHEFRKRHYSAHRMTVAIQSRQTLEDLEQYVINTFGLVPSNFKPSDDFTAYNFNSSHVTPEFHSFYHVKPVRDCIELHLTWLTRSIIKDYKSKPHEYLSFLLGHEGEGSLLSYLKKKVWALGLYSGNSAGGIEDTSIYGLYSTQITLTQEGLEHVDEVIDAVFSYINMLKMKGPSERLFKELQSIAETSVKFEEESQPSDNVMSLSENMHLYPPQHYITGENLYFEYNPGAIREVLDLLSPDTVNLMLFTKNNVEPVVYDSRERWFGTEYHKSEISPTRLEHWSAIKPFTDFHLPLENVYIPTNFELIPMPVGMKDTPDENQLQLAYVGGKPETAATETGCSLFPALVESVPKMQYPTLVRKNNLMELWYKPDYKFRLPAAFLYFYFISPLSLSTVKDACMMDLWSLVLVQDLKEPMYAANMAGLSHNVYPSDKGIVLKVNGYNEKIHLFTDTITSRMRTCSDNMTEGLFKAVVDVQGKAYYNSAIKPGKLIKEVRLRTMLAHYYTVTEKLAALPSVTYKELVAFGPRFLQHLYVQVLAQGNLHRHEAENVVDTVMRNVEWKELSGAGVPKIQVHKVPLGDMKLRVAGLNANDSNTIVTNYYQSGVSILKDTVTLEFILMLMDEPLFNTLRTKEQLGYSVSCLLRYTYGVLGYSITVNTEADKYSANHVDLRIELFLREFARKIRRLPEKVFSETKADLIKVKRNADVELKEEVSRNWGEITAMEYIFDRQAREIEAISKLRLSDIRAWFESHSASGSQSNLRKLSVQVVGTKKSNQVEQPRAAESISEALNIKFLGAQLSEKEDPIQFLTDMDVLRNTTQVYKIDGIHIENC